MALDHLSRQSVLNDRHLAAGGDIKTASWNDMPVPQTYRTNPYDEVEAVRYRAGLFDVSALRILNLSGPDSLRFLNEILTSDVAKAKEGDSHISNIVDENGAIIDDVLVYVDGKDKYTISHGGGDFEKAMLPIATKYDVKIEKDNDVHILSLQGPVALEVLESHTPMDLASLKYFHHEATTLFEKPVRIARGGYSAERGYEVFCAAVDAPFIWDKILDAGKQYGVVPASWACLDILRIEGGLLFFPYDMPQADTTPWEVRAHWTVDLSKPDFIGKKALQEKLGKERSFISGIEIEHTGAVEAGSKITANGEEIGVVTSSTFSQHLMKSIALAQIVPAFTKLGTQIVVHDNGEKIATVVKTPFYDPLRLRTHPPE